MIVADILGALGNQLFCYAATRSIARDLGLSYRYRVCPPAQTRIANPTYNNEGSFIDKLGQEFNPHFENVFHIDTGERIEDIPEQIRSVWTWQRSTLSNHDAGVYNISASTHLTGFFMHPAYFTHRRHEVLGWLRFKDPYVEKARLTADKIRRQTASDHLVSVHVRCGLSYRLARQTLDQDYHRRAMDLVQTTFPQKKLTYILFSDMPAAALRQTRGKHRTVLHAGTMFEDLCLMTQCDSHIVVNSTFSWWGAWLADQTRGIVVRPSIWPASLRGQYAPTDMFPDEWLTVEACREKMTFRGLTQRIRDEYSPGREPCEAYPSWFDHYVRRPLHAFLNGHLG